MNGEIETKADLKGLFRVMKLSSTVVYYSIIYHNALEGIMLSVIRQSEKDKYHKFHSLTESKKKTE